MYPTHCKRIVWELGRWIVAHYDRITELLISWFDMPGYGAPDTDDILCISLASKLRPSPDEYSPIGVMAVLSMALVDVADRHNATGLRCLPDPAPGAHITLAEAKASARKIMKVICYCEPVAFELEIPLPGRAALMNWPPGPSPAERVAALSDPSFLWSGKVHCPVQARPVDQSLQAVDEDERLKRWISFYFAVLHGAAYTAVHSWSTDSNVVLSDCLFVVQLQRRDNYASLVHVAFSYSVVTCAAISRSQFPLWCESRGHHFGAKEMSQIVTGVGDRLEATPENLSAATLVFVQLDDPSLTPQCMLSPDTAFGQYSPRAWINHLPPPKDFLDAYVEHGFWLGMYPYTREDGPPRHSFNVWGHFDYSQAPSEVVRSVSV
jgi:hypothetical protein